MSIFATKSMEQLKAEAGDAAAPVGLRGTRLRGAPARTL